MNTSCAVWCSSSPCSVRMSPRAWRWNSETPSSCSSADTCRDTADCERPRCSPAWVKLPASAAAWKTLSLSQSMLSCTFLRGHSAAEGGFAFAQRRKEALGLERRHAALSGGGNRLPIDVVSDVAGGEYARHRGGGRERRGADIARQLHLDLSDEQLGSRGVADGDEHAIGRHLGSGLGLDVAKNDAADLERDARRPHVVENAVPDHRNLRVLEQPVLQDLLGAETVAPMHDA